MAQKEIPVLLSVTGESRQEGQQEERIHLVTAGRLVRTERGFALRYEEAQPESGEVSHITLAMENGSVTMIRDGAYATSMVFEKGRRFQGNYRTPMGDLDMGIYATKVRFSVSEEKGDVSLRYQLDLQGQFVAMHELNLYFVRQGGPHDLPPS